MRIHDGAWKGIANALSQSCPEARSTDWLPLGDGGPSVNTPGRGVSTSPVQFTQLRCWLVWRVRRGLLTQQQGLKVESRD